MNGRKFPCEVIRPKIFSEELLLCMVREPVLCCFPIDPPFGPKNIVK
jgi:hypothetical protein